MACLIAFAGGLSAATTMVIFPSIILSIMISNDLLLPVLLRRASQLANIETTGFYQDHPQPEAGCSSSEFLLAAFAYQFTISGHVDFTGLALVSAIAMMQLLPPFLGGLFWRRGTARGARWGMLGGFCVWAYTMVLPTMLDMIVISAHRWPVRIGRASSPCVVWLGGQQLRQRADVELISQYDVLYRWGRFREVQPLSSASRPLYSLLKTRLSMNAIGSLQPSVTVDQLKTTISKYIGSEQTDLAFRAFHKQENISTRRR